MVSRDEVWYRLLSPHLMVSSYDNHSLQSATHQQCVHQLNHLIRPCPLKHNSMTEPILASRVDTKMWKHAIPCSVTHKKNRWKWNSSMHTCSQIHTSCPSSYQWPLKKRRKRRKRKTIKCINWVNHVLSLLHILPTSSPPHSVTPFLSGSVTRVLSPCLACDSVHCSFSHPSLVTPPPPTLQLSSYRSLSSSFTLLLLHLPIFLLFILSPPPIFKSS